MSWESEGATFSVILADCYSDLFVSLIEENNKNEAT